METTYELHEGINGSGNTKWLVVAVSNKTGQWLHIHEFDNKPEAASWVKWA